MESGTVFSFMKTTCSDEKAMEFRTEPTFVISHKWDEGETRDCSWNTDDETGEGCCATQML